VGHADVFKHGVVPAGRTVVVPVERTQVGVEPVGAGTRLGFLGPGDHAQVRRRGTEPLLGFVGTNPDAHGVTHFFAGEHQIVLNLLLGQTDVLEAVVTHGRSAVAAQAVIHEELGAILQGGLIVGNVRSLVQFQGGTTGQHRQGCEKQCEEQFFHFSRPLLSG